MAAKKARKPGFNQDWPFTSPSVGISVGDYGSRNKNAGRDKEQVLRDLQKSIQKSGATRVGEPSWTFTQERGMGGRRTGTTASVSQRVVVPGKGVQVITSSKTNRSGAIDTSKTSMAPVKPSKPKSKPRRGTR